MKLLQDIQSLSTALDKASKELTGISKSVTVPLTDALGRVVTKDIIAVSPVPHFRRSTMDGYAVSASDTVGASESIPAMMTLNQDCSSILTGGLLPDKADAVVMLEYAEELEDGTVLMYRPVASGENVIDRGEDIPVGEVVVAAGELLSSRKLAMLASLGHTQVAVAKFRIALFSTGNEVVGISTDPPPGKIRDINSHYLWALLHEYGLTPELKGIIPDDETALYNALSNALENYDAVVLSGGSSAGALDFSRRVLDKLGAPGVLTHGLAIKPGKPTLIAVVSGKLVLALPGHPLSCALTAHYVALPLLQRAAGAALSQTPSITLPLSRSVASVPGRRDFVAIKVIDGQAVPLMSKSASISALGYSDGVLVIEEDCEGLAAGSKVKVELWGLK